MLAAADRQERGGAEEEGEEEVLAREGWRGGRFDVYQR